MWKALPATAETAPLTPGALAKPFDPAGFPRLAQKTGNQGAAVENQ